MCADNVNAVAREWNGWRETVLREAVMLHLLPVMEAEARQHLLLEAKEAALTKWVLRWGKRERE